MSKIANSWWMYLLGAIVSIFVLVGSILFIIQSYKDAKKIGMDKKILKQTIINSAIFTILPSISILIGVVSLSNVIGIPLPWIRLTVIGALHYEGTAVNVTYGSINLASLTSQQFVTIALVMTLGIISGPIYCLFGFKTYDKKVLSKAQQIGTDTEVKQENDTDDKSKVEVKVSEANPAVKKKTFGSILFDIVFIGMICAFLGIEVAKYFRPKKDYTGVMQEPSFYPMIAIIVAFLTMALCDLLEKKLKQKWLGNFALGFSMIMGMAAAVIAGLIK